MNLRALLGLARRERLPDFLEGSVRFDCDGLGVTFYPVARGDWFFWLVAFQNRYERPCRARVRLRPSRPGFPFRRQKVPEVSARIQCDGGAFGTVIVPSFVPAEYQGQLVRYLVSGATTWPARRGPRLRPRRGAAAGRWSGMAGDNVFDLLHTFRFGAEPPVRYRLPATPVCTGNLIPSLVGAEEQTLTIFWRPGDPLEKALEATASLPS